MKKHACPKPARLRGSVMVEYTVSALILILALFTPVPPADESVADMIMTAIRNNHKAKAYAIGNPVVGSSTEFLQ